MHRPGTISQPGFPMPIALLEIASSMIFPQLTVLVGERRKKARTLSDRIETATVRIVFAKMSGNAFGKMCRRRIRQLGTPTIRALSTNTRSLMLSTWLRITRAVTDQPVRPMKDEPCEVDHPQ